MLAGFISVLVMLFALAGARVSKETELTQPDDKVTQNVEVSMSFLFGVVALCAARYL